MAAFDQSVTRKIFDKTIKEFSEASPQINET